MNYKEILYSNADRIMKVRSGLNNDIFEHLPTLYKYSTNCDSAIELGVRNCISSYPIIKGLLDNPSDKPKRMISVDLHKSKNSEDFEGLAKKFLNFDFIVGNDLSIDINENFDLVFIDTWHVRGQLERELKKYSQICNKYIILHDTTVDEYIGESIRNSWNINKQSKETGFTAKEIMEGLWPAVTDFLELNKDWEIKERYKNNNGLTILEKIVHIDIVNDKEKCIDKIINVMHANNCKNIEIILYQNCKVFYEITRTLKNQLLDRGISCAINDSVKIKKLDTFYLLFDSHRDTKPFDFALKYAVFNYEQPGSLCMKDQKYLSKMAMGNVVFDYSNYNKSIIEKYINKPIIVAPYNYHPTLTVLNQNLNNDEPIDILFYGSTNPARQKYHDILKKSDYKVKFISDYSAFTDNLCNEWKKCKIVLNIHYYNNPSVLELSRIIPLIANHKLVLSERSDDTEADARFEDMVVFINQDNILDKCKEYLDDPIKRHNKEKKAFEILTSENM